MNKHIHLTIRLNFEPNTMKSTGNKNGHEYVKIKKKDEYKSQPEHMRV